MPDPPSDQERSENEVAIPEEAAALPVGSAKLFESPPVSAKERTYTVVLLLQDADNLELETRLVEARSAYGAVVQAVCYSQQIEPTAAARYLENRVWQAEVFNVWGGAVNIVLPAELLEIAENRFVAAEVVVGDATKALAEARDAMDYCLSWVQVTGSEA